MRVACLLMGLWPGCNNLWRRGEWTALGHAIAFTWLFIGLLATTFLWPGALSSSWTALGWGAWGVWWCGFLWLRQTGPKLPVETPRDSENSAPMASPDLLIQAQVEYLRGHWFECQELLEKQVESSRDDVEARLLLATLFRRRGQPQQAERHLRLIEQQGSGDAWATELHAERQLLAVQSDQTLQSEEQGEQKPVVEDAA